MSKITIIGDVHGKTAEYVNLLKHLPEGHASIQVGDMGLGFKGVGLPPPGKSMPQGDHTFFRGNHDSPQKCRTNPYYRGDYGYDAENRLFWLAGAWSIDKDWRVPGETWWEDEELSYSELQEAITWYDQWKPEFVLSHEAPTKAAFAMLSGLLIPTNDPYNITSVKKNAEYGYYKAKLGCVNTRTSQALQCMLDMHAPKEWVFGHYHVNQHFDLPGYKTKFTCVAELSTYELETSNGNSDTSN